MARADGRWLLINERRLPDGGLISLATDITEVKQAERKIRELNETLEERVRQRTRDLRESEARNREILTSAGEGIYGLDEHGLATFVNPAACEMLGYAADQLIGRPMHDVVHPERADGSPCPAHDCARVAAITEGRAHAASDEMFWRQDGTSVPVMYTTTPIERDGKLVGAVVTFSDITEIMSHEAALERYTKELERSNAELEFFAYVASHDLQEPLRKIQIFSERLMQKYGQALDERGQIYVDRIASSAIRLRALIDDLLEFSRINTAGKPFSPTNLDDVLRQVLDDLETTIQQVDAKILVDKLPTIDADATQMGQLLQNLVANALKFRRDGERLSIDIRGGVEQGGAARDQRSAVCRIVVTDNGIGFEPKFSERIFGAFERLHSRGAYPGTGIGLATCKKIVERHGGNIAAAGEPGKGATFTITLPVAHEEADTSPDKI